MIRKVLRDYTKGPYGEDLNVIFNLNCACSSIMLTVGT